MLNKQVLRGGEVPGEVEGEISGDWCDVKMGEDGKDYDDCEEFSMDYVEVLYVDNGVVVWEEVEPSTKVIGFEWMFVLKSGEIIIEVGGWGRRMLDWSVLWSEGVDQCSG